MTQTEPACLTLPTPPRAAVRRPGRRSWVDAALVALAFGFVAALTVVGTGPSPGPVASIVASD
jgi:hypothetical protein